MMISSQKGRNLATVVLAVVAVLGFLSVVVALGSNKADSDPPWNAGEMESVLLDEDDLGHGLAEVNIVEEGIDVGFDHITSRDEECSATLDAVRSLDENLFFGSGWGSRTRYVKRTFSGAQYGEVSHVVVIGAPWIARAYRAIVEKCSRMEVDYPGKGTIEGIRLQMINSSAIGFHDLTFADTSEYPEVDNRYLRMIWVSDGIVSAIQLGGTFDAAGRYVNPSLEQLESIAKMADDKLQKVIDGR